MTSDNHPSPPRTTDDATIAHFGKDSHGWWQEDGAFSPLHRLNPLRLSFIMSALHRMLPTQLNAGRQSLAKLRVLDIGCGGGLVCEPLARLDATVTGIDADANAIRAAQNHAGTQDLVIDYACAAPEDLSDALHGTFDVVLALEVIEHVKNPAAFIALCAKLVRPGGVFICSTLNRTPISYLTAIIGAEYVTRWVPRGTHQWSSFIKPHELSDMARNVGLDLQAIDGFHYHPLRGDFSLSPKGMSVNYIAAFLRTGNP
ncbi:MAG: bifunctional 2-polyprenyl-6-hydroxyphenol methylase/3-demethylubiquinol 3-O-methyltransferase UbiG [Pseudomonadota bacterium]